MFTDDPTYNAGIAAAMVSGVAFLTAVLIGVRAAILTRIEKKNTE